MGQNQSTESNNENTRGVTGTALIINHDNFLHHETRTGTDTDVTNLRTMFTRLGFDVPFINSDMTTRQVREIISHYAKKTSYPKHSCLVVVVLSHGEESGKIYSYDSHYRTKDIWEPFKNTLKGQPKLFFFQACRGQTNEKKIIPESQEPIIGENVINNTIIERMPSYKLAQLPNNSDFFLAFSTVEHRTSKRHVIDGTWYIETICKEISKLNKPEELFTFMTRVTKSVVEKRHIETGQTPTFISMLKNQIYVPVFRPDNITSEPLNEDSGIKNDGAAPNQILQDNISNDCPPKQSESLTHEELQDPPTQTHYQWKNKKRGRALIFHSDQEYRMSAEGLEKCLNNLKFDVKLIEFSNVKDNFQIHLNKVMQDVALKDECCIVVAVFSSIEHNVRHEDELELEECYIKTKNALFPINYTWNSFLASKCENLINKPKLFFFLDHNYDLKEDSANKSIKVAPDEVNASVTEHSDFFFVHGHSQAFIKCLSIELRKSRDEGQDIHCAITNAINQEADNENSSSRLPHFESTLRFQLVFENVTADSTDIEITSPENYLESRLSILSNLSSMFENIKEKCFWNKENTWKMMKKMNKKLNDLLEVNQKLLKEIFKLENTANILEREIEDLSHKNRKMKQFKKENQFIIENIPQRKNENLRKLLKQICNHLQIQNFDTSMIEKIKRKLNKNKLNPPMIVVTLKSVELRNKIINNKKKIFTNDIGYYDCNNRIYINPYLAKETYKFFKKVKTLLQNSNGLIFEIVNYSSNGEIFVKKTKHSKAIIVPSLIFIQNILKDPSGYSYLLEK